MRTASQNLFYFSGQTAKPSPSTLLRSNWLVWVVSLLYGHFYDFKRKSVRSTARSVTIGLSPCEVKSDPLDAGRRVQNHDI